MILGRVLGLILGHTHTHTQPFYCSCGICPGQPGEQVPES